MTRNGGRVQPTARLHRAAPPLAKCRGQSPGTRRAGTEALLLCNSASGRLKLVRAAPSLGDCLETARKTCIQPGGCILRVAFFLLTATLVFTLLTVFSALYGAAIPNIRSTQRVFFDANGKVVRDRGREPSGSPRPTRVAGGASPAPGRPRRFRDLPGDAGASRRFRDARRRRDPSPSAAAASDEAIRIPAGIRRRAVPPDAAAGEDLPPARRRRHPGLQPARPHLPRRPAVPRARRAASSSTSTTFAPSSTRRSSDGATPFTGWSALRNGSPTNWPIRWWPPTRPPGKRRCRAEASRPGASFPSIPIRTLVLHGRARGTPVKTQQAKTPRCRAKSFSAISA